MSSISIYDPTASDELSKVRGVGRYVQILRENLKNDALFTSNLDEVPKHSTFVNPFFNFLQQPLKIRRISRKQVAVIHDIIPLKYPKHYPVGIKGGVYKRINRLTLRRYDLIITSSKSSKLDLITLLNVPERIIHVVYPILSTSFFNNKERKPSTFTVPDTFLLYVGDATWNKNLVTLAKAIKLGSTACIFAGKVFSSYMNQNPDHMTHPELQELKQFLKLAKGDGRFIFPGFISDEELVYLYKHAAANVLVSRDEGFGYSFLEAAALHTPSVLADEPIFHETAKESALFAKTNSSKDIAEKLQEITKNSSLRKILAEKAYKRSKDFGPAAFKKQFIDAVESKGYYEV